MNYKTWYANPILMQDIYINLAWVLFYALLSFSLQEITWALVVQLFLFVVYLTFVVARFYVDYQTAKVQAHRLSKIDTAQPIKWFQVWDLEIGVVLETVQNCTSRQNVLNYVHRSSRKYRKLIIRHSMLMDKINSPIY